MTDSETVKTIINAHLSRPLDALDPATPINEALNDSFAYVEMALELEQAFDVRLSDGEFRDLTTIGDLVAAMDMHFEPKRTASSPA